MSSIRGSKDSSRVKKKQLSTQAQTKKQKAIQISPEIKTQENPTFSTNKQLPINKRKTNELSQNRSSTEDSNLNPSTETKSLDTLSQPELTNRTVSKESQTIHILPATPNQTHESISALFPNQTLENTQDIKLENRSVTQDKDATNTNYALFAKINSAITQLFPALMPDPKRSTDPNLFMRWMPSAIGNTAANIAASSLSYYIAKSAVQTVLGPAGLNPVQLNVMSLLVSEFMKFGSAAITSRLEETTNNIIAYGLVPAAASSQINTIASAANSSELGKMINNQLGDILKIENLTATGVSKAVTASVSKAVSLILTGASANVLDK